MMIFRSGGILGARQKLLAYSRIAYQKVTGTTSSAPTDPPAKVPPGPPPVPTEGTK